jgi:hypothetical protein
MIIIEMYMIFRKSKIKKFSNYVHVNEQEIDMRFPYSFSYSI